MISQVYVVGTLRQLKVYVIYDKVMLQVQHERTGKKRYETSKQPQDVFGWAFKSLLQAVI